MSNESRDKSQKKTSQYDEPVIVFYPPLKRNPKLMWISASVLGVWFVALLILYFTSIVPSRQRAADRREKWVDQPDPVMTPPAAKPAVPNFRPATQPAATTQLTVPR